MRAENIEQIREHLARGGRAIYGNQWVVEAVTATGRVLLGNGNYLESYTFDSRDWELLPIEETPEERQAWIEKAEHDFPIDFEKTKHRGIRMGMGYERVQKMWQALHLRYL